MEQLVSVDVSQAFVRSFLQEPLGHTLNTHIPFLVLEATSNADECQKNPLAHMVHVLESQAAQLGYLVVQDLQVVLLES